MWCPFICLSVCLSSLNSVDWTLLVRQCIPKIGKLRIYLVLGRLDKFFLVNFYWVEDLRNSHFVWIPWWNLVWWWWKSSFSSSLFLLNRKENKFIFEFFLVLAICTRQEVWWSPECGILPILWIKTKLRIQPCVSAKLPIFASCQRSLEQPSNSKESLDPWLHLLDLGDGSDSPGVPSSHSSFFSSLH